MGSDCVDRPFLQYQLEVTFPTADGIQKTWATQLSLLSRTKTALHGVLAVPKLPAEKLTGFLSRLQEGPLRAQDLWDNPKLLQISEVCAYLNLCEKQSGGCTLTENGANLLSLEPEKQKSYLHQLLLSDPSTRFGIEFNWNSRTGPEILKKEGSQRAGEVALGFVRATFEAYAKAIVLDNAGTSLSPALLSEISGFESQLIVRGHIRKPHTAKIGAETVIRRGTIVNERNLSPEDLERAKKVVAFWNDLIVVYSQNKIRTVGFKEWVQEAVETKDEKRPVYLEIGRRFQRDIIQVRTTEGWQPFYRSTGNNSRMPGRWLPFDGIFRDSHAKPWFDKARFCPEGDLERFGTLALKDLSDQLSKEEIPTLRPKSVWDINEALGYTKLTSLLEAVGCPKSQLRAQTNKPTEGEFTRVNRGLHELMTHGQTTYTETFELLNLELGSDGRPTQVEPNPDLDIPSLMQGSPAGQELEATIGAAQTLIEEYKALEEAKEAYLQP